ncbi:hypothetical protein KNP414_00207 [Paenibacillus mucilaginosus KNP414]|uniref:Uncharacterized protein n=1 Tax=Paenibacillus mucilaginosus (strain KNP414) TaxID=1036673 RepID=F8FKZ0_PAEMK|nr:hypothetical protein KNP414_00207 [Paenibacillus mucilaginosus KNP414]
MVFFHKAQLLLLGLQPDRCKDMAALLVQARPLSPRTGRVLAFLPLYIGRCT